MQVLPPSLGRFVRPAFLAFTAVLASACGADPSPAASSPVASGPEPATPVPPLVIGLEAAYPPFESMNDKGEMVGFDVELARGLARSLGRDAEFRNMAFDSLIPELQAGRIDLVCSGMSYTDERAKTVDFSRPYVRTTMAVLVSTVKAAGVGTIADLDADGVVIAVHRGTTGEQKAKGAFPRAKVEPYDTEVDASAQVEAGRAHAFVYDLQSVRKLAARAPDKLRVLDGDLGAEAYCMAFRKGSPLVGKAREYLDGISAPGGEMDRMVERWELTAEPVRPGER